jgi:hypothetical protein
MKRSRRSQRPVVCSLTVIAVLWAAGVVICQDAFPAKPFVEWTRADAEKLLDSSAWAINQELRVRYAQQMQSVAGASGGNSEAERDRGRTELGGANAPVDFTFKLRLRSALPIREALVRLKQIDAKYDRMSESERANFDERLKGLLECPACEQNYVLSLSSKSRNSPGADAVFSLFKGGRLNELQRYVFLANDRGEKRNLIHFVPPKVPGDEATFFFPRFDDKGVALFGPENKEIILNLNNNQVSTITNFRVDIAPLVHQGTVIF